MIYFCPNETGVAQTPSYPNSPLDRRFFRVWTRSSRGLGVGPSRRASALEALAEVAPCEESLVRLEDGPLLGLGDCQPHVLGELVLTCRAVKGGPELRHRGRRCPRRVMTTAE